jgi:hypothetical protein
MKTCGDELLDTKAGECNRRDFILATRIDQLTERVAKLETPDKPAEADEWRYYRSSHATYPACWR